METKALRRMIHKKAFLSSVFVLILCTTESKDNSRTQFRKYFDWPRHNENINNRSYKTIFLTPNLHLNDLGSSNLDPKQSSSFSSLINTSQINAVPGTASNRSSSNVIHSSGIGYASPVNSIPLEKSKEVLPVKKIVIDAIYRTFSNSSPSLSRTRRRVAGNLLDKEEPSSRSLDLDENPLAKGRKHPGGNPKIDDIIHGIMKLLGGNVKLKAPETRETKLTTFNNPSKFVTSTRINNRGPPRMPMLPFGILPPVVPIRPPVTPPSDGNKPDGPQFVANTRPPFLVPLPPALNSRPGVKFPFVTGIPIPEDVLSQIKMKVTPSEDSVTTSVTPSFADASENSEVNTIDNLPEETKDDAEDEVSSTESVSTEASAVPQTPDIELSSTTMLESSMSSSSTSSTDSSASSTTSTFVKSINLISQKATPSLSNIKSTSSVITSASPSSATSSEEIWQPATPTNVPTIESSSDISFQLVSTVTTLPSTNTHVSALTLLPSPSSTFAFLNFPTLLPGPLKPYATTGHPGMVFEDIVTSSVYQGQVITAPHPFNHQPDVFDVTVSALQGYGSSPVQPPQRRYEGVMAPLLTTAQKSADGSVFIDGRKTYFDLMPATKKFIPAGVNQVQTLGVGTVIPEAVEQTFSKGFFKPSAPVPLSANTLQRASPRPPLAADRSTTLGPPKRIDTCIVGYDTTCKEELGEVCRTEGDVSSCFCRPGTARKKTRSQCKKSVLLHLSLKVDRVGNRRIVWSGNYANPEAKEYQMLVYEAEKALDSALGQSRAMSGLYMESSVNKFYSLGGRVIVNSTIKLLHTPQTASPTIRKSLQRHLIRIIQTNNNYVGNSILAVEGPLNPIPDVSDVNECFDSSLYDCHSEAVCTNTFGSYICDCKKGFTDRYPDDPNKSGRFCDSCSRDFCSKKGECRIEEGYHICVCEDKYYGARCEIDGEVIAVAVGASVAAVVIIILTLIFLCMWSQRWKAQDRKTEILSRLPGGLFGGFRARGVGRDTFSVDIHQKGSVAGAYGITMEDRIRWAQIAENLVQQNVYTDRPLTSNPGRNIDPVAVQNLKALLEGGAKRGSLVQDVLRLITRRGQKPKTKEFPQLTPEEALVLHQMITLQAQLRQENQPEQMRSTAFYEQRKVLPPPSEYASVGTVSGIPPQQFGMHHLNPPYLPQPYGSKAHSTYNQFGPPGSNNVPSVGGISRAPTIGARTPLPVRDLLGGTSMGPFGGGITTKSGNKDGIGALLTESSEEDPDRPYQLPRPKSRSSALDNDDFYFDPDDMMTSHPSRFPPPLPSSPPPPIPYQFDQFFKSKFP